MLSKVKLLEPRGELRIERHGKLVRLNYARRFDASNDEWDAISIECSLPVYRSAIHELEHHGACQILDDTGRALFIRRVSDAAVVLRLTTLTPSVDFTTEPVPIESSFMRV